MTGALALSGAIVGAAHGVALVWLAGKAASAEVKECTCTPAMVTRYQKRISGPLLDRIDAHGDLPRVEYERLSGGHFGERSSAIR